MSLLSFKIELRMALLARNVVIAYGTERERSEMSVDQVRSEPLKQIP